LGAAASSRGFAAAGTHHTDAQHGRTDQGLGTGGRSRCGALTLSQGKSAEPRSTC